MTNQFIFIILPVYNGEKYILQQLMSVYYQTFKNWYLVIINDGSNDNTVNIIESFIKNYKLQYKVKLLTKENAGVNKAIETGLIEIQKIKPKFQGDVFVSYCDADDIWMRNKLEYEVNYIIKNNGDLCYHDLVVIDENDNIISNSYKKMLHSPMNNIYDNSFLKFCLCNHITSTSMLFKYNYVGLILPICNGLYQDWYTSLVISGLNGKILSINKPLAYYRRHQNSMLSSNKKSLSDFFNEFINVLLNIKGRCGKANEGIIDYVLDYYYFRLKHLRKKRLYNILCMIRYPKIVKYYIKSYISYFLKR